jgi:nucleoside-diphosphate-sugar epimerase
MNDDKKILLTGGSGLVGKNIREHPSADKWEILHRLEETLI